MGFMGMGMQEIVIIAIVALIIFGPERLPEMAGHPASRAQFSKDGVPYRAGDILRQPDLSRTLRRIEEQGPNGFYKGQTAKLIATEMQAHDGLLSLEDLEGYRARKRACIVGTYRGHDIISMPPPSSGGIALVES